jgi:hypothetical protein
MNLQLKVAPRTCAGPRVNVTGCYGVLAAQTSPRSVSPAPTADPKTLERLALKAAVKADAKAVALSGAVLSLDDRS